jgi:hypothetical protein
MRGDLKEASAKREGLADSGRLRDMAEDTKNPLIREDRK